LSSRGIKISLTVFEYMSLCFLIDGMLGSLARWLRIGGYDTVFRRDADDDALIEETMNEHRILVTRDRALFFRARKQRVKTILIESENNLEQLAEVALKENLILEPKESRCPKCNGSLEKKEKENLEDRVPHSSLKAFNDFWECRSCGSIYWKGSHWSQILLSLEEARRKALRND
jgi:uncharacterized protein with PIN domain